MGGFGSGAGACFWVGFLVWFPCGRRSSWFGLSGCFAAECGSTGVLWLVTAGFRWFGGGEFGCGGVWMFRVLVCDLVLCVLCYSFLDWVVVWGGC